MKESDFKTNIYFQTGGKNALTNLSCKLNARRLQKAAKDCVKAAKDCVKDAKDCIKAKKRLQNIIKWNNDNYRTKRCKEVSSREK